MLRVNFEVAKHILSAKPPGDSKDQHVAVELLLLDYSNLGPDPAFLNAAAFGQMKVYVDPEVAKTVLALGKRFHCDFTEIPNVLPQ